MKINYRAIIFFLLILGTTMIVHGSSRCYACEDVVKHNIQHKEEKPQPKELTAKEVFNQMAQPTPWIYGFIDRNTTKKESERYIINHEGL